MTAHNILKSSRITRGAGIHRSIRVVGGKRVGVIARRLSRPVLSLTRLTRLLATLKALARNGIRPRLALPSTGGVVMRTLRLSAPVETDNLIAACAWLDTHREQ
jgi:hypothetical protein